MSPYLDEIYNQRLYFDHDTTEYFNLKKVAKDAQKKTKKATKSVTKTTKNITNSKEMKSVTSNINKATKAIEKTYEESVPKDVRDGIKTTYDLTPGAMIIDMATNDGKNTNQALNNIQKGTKNLKNKVDKVAPKIIEDGKKITGKIESGIKKTVKKSTGFLQQLNPFTKIKNLFCQLSNPKYSLFIGFIIALIFRFSIFGNILSEIPYMNYIIFILFPMCTYYMLNTIC